MYQYTSHPRIFLHWTGYIVTDRTGIRENMGTERMEQEGIEYKGLTKRDEEDKNKDPWDEEWWASGCCHVS